MGSCGGTPRRCYRPGVTHASPARFGGLLCLVVLGLVACGPAAASPAVSGSTTPVATASLPALVLPEGTPVLPAAGLSYPAAALDATRSAALDQALRNAAAAHGVVGVSAAVLIPGQGAWTGAIGSADLARGNPMIPSSRLAVASITKTFVAALVLELATEGVMSLDAPIRTLVPDLPPTVPADVTVRELLNHTSGVADYIDDAALLVSASRSPTRPVPTDALLRAIPKPLFPAGRGWAYSNADYLLLGLAVERSTGRSLAALIRERLTGPLRLDSIRYQPEETPGTPITVGYSVAGRGASGATDAGDGLMPNRAFVDIASSAGGISATALDVARWGAALYGGRVLPPSALDGMLSFLPRYDYGLGAQRRTIDGMVAIGHHGRTLGYASALDELVGSGIVISVIANSDAVDVGAIVEALARIAR